MKAAGVIIAGFGSPASLGEVGAFVKSLTGRDVPPSVLADLTAKYAAIGGGSPLGRIAAELADGVSRALARAGRPMPVEVGMRHSEPSLKDAVRRLLSDGIERVILTSLSPHASMVTTGAYRATVEEVLAEEGRSPGGIRPSGGTVALAEGRPLSELPVYTSLFAQSAASALACAPEGALVVFSAHSLPVSRGEAESVYVRGVRSTAADVARRLDFGNGAMGEVVQGVVGFGSPYRPHGVAGPKRAASGETPACPWLVAYQSRGRAGGEWLGPSLDDAVDAAARTGRDGVVIVPVGFATDHLETLYDLDILARERAERAGIAYARAAVPNADPCLAEAIAAEVLSLARTSD